MMQQDIPPLVLLGDYKTQLCRNWTPPDYVCPFGEYCWYAHGLVELREVSQPILPLVQQPFLPLVQQQPILPLVQQQPILPLAEPILPVAAIQGGYKTQMCRNWKAPDYVCPYGGNCRFAHGIRELRRVQFYKTRDCRYGQDCPYGENCDFIHNYDTFGHPLHLVESLQEDLHSIRRASTAAGPNPPNQG